MCLKKGLETFQEKYKHAEKNLKENFNTQEEYKNENLGKIFFFLNNL